jgi:hypothetical protein
VRLLAVGLPSGAACTAFGTSVDEAPNAGDASIDSDASDASIDQAGDAAGGLGACGDGGLRFALSFGSADDLRWFVPRDNDSGPSIELDAGVTLLQPVQEARDSLWFPNPVPLDTFDVTFETLVTCPSTPGLWCGDGIAFVWLGATSVDEAFDGGVNQGATFGIPSKTGGNAVALDLVQGGAPQNDPDVPALEIITLDSGLYAAQYPWVVSGANVPALGQPAWNTIVISVRNGNAVVSAGGLQLEAGVAPLARGMFGLTAATGADVAGFKVRNLRASFGCAPAP